jgi:FkbM family methyltransferase
MIVTLKLKKLDLPDYPIYLNPNDSGLSQQLIKWRIREPINTYFLSKMIRNLKPDVLDVGGNIGYFPLIEVLSEAKTVTAYEPVSDSFKFLVKNLIGFPNVKFYNRGLSDRIGVETIFVTDKRNMSTIIPDKNILKLGNIKIVGSEKIRMTTLKEACSKIWSSNILVRMDIEGYETKVLKEIPDKVKYLSFELHTDILGRKKSIDFLDYIEAEGFKIFLITRDLAGLGPLFTRFGFKVFEIWNRLKEKRIYRVPTKQDRNYVVKICRENLHIFASKRV